MGQSIIVGTVSGVEPDNLLVMKPNASAVMLYSTPAIKSMTSYFRAKSCPALSILLAISV